MIGIQVQKVPKLISFGYFHLAIHPRSFSDSVSKIILFVRHQVYIL